MELHTFCISYITFLNLLFCNAFFGPLILNIYLRLCVLFCFEELPFEIATKQVTILVTKIKSQKKKTRGKVESIET